MEVVCITATATAPSHADLRNTESSLEVLE